MGKKRKGGQGNKGRNSKSMKIGDLAYEVLSEAEKEKRRKQLREDLKKGKKGLYHTPGGTRYHV